MCRRTGAPLRRALTDTDQEVYTAQNYTVLAAYSSKTVATYCRPNSFSSTSSIRKAVSSLVPSSTSTTPTTQPSRLLLPLDSLHKLEPRLPRSTMPALKSSVRSSSMVRGWRTHLNRISLWWHTTTTHHRSSSYGPGAG